MALLMNVTLCLLYGRLFVNVAFRINLKQLDEMTVGLRRRLLVGHEAEEQAALYSDIAVPLSTSSAFVTGGSTQPTGTWELRSTLHSNQHLAPDVRTSAGDSTTTGDVVTELMRRTLECADNTYVKELSHQKHAVNDDDVEFGNSAAVNQTSDLPLRNNEYEQENSDMGASAGFDRSLKNAQMLLEKVNEITACNSQLTAVSSDHRVHSPTAVNFDDDGMHEDDSLADIWALRQSARHDDDDDDDDDDDASLDSAVLPNERDESYILPRALNDVGSNPDDFSILSHTAIDAGGGGDAERLAESDVGSIQQPPVNCVDESGDRWYIDTQDVRNIDDEGAVEIQQRLADNKLPNVDEVVKVMRDASVQIGSPGRPLSQSSPSQLSTAGSTGSSAGRRSRLMKRTAVQRREQMYREQCAGDSTDSESDVVASVRLHHRHTRNTQHAPCNDRPPASNHSDPSPVNDAPSALVNDHGGDVEGDVVGHYQQAPPLAKHDSEDNDEEEQSASSGIITVLCASQGSLVLNDATSVSDDRAFSGHNSVSGEDLYPS